MSDRTARRLAVAWSFAVVAGVAAIFYVAGLRATHGVWPAPLDDVYIHYDFARSAAAGHPFTWVVGNGYSSGGTSLVYPLLLAPGYALGLRGPSLGMWAAVIATVSVVDLTRSVTAVLALRRAWPARFLALGAPVALVAVPLLDWTWFSGMEVALAGAFLGRALRAAERSSRASPHRRRRAQLAAGIYLALLAMTRPECAVLAPLVAVSIARRSGSLGPFGSLARAGLPLAAALVLQAVMNRTFTGETAAAGAVRKLITENPYASGSDAAVLILKNFAELRTAGIDLPLGGRWGSAAVHALALVACVDRRTRALAIPLVMAAYAVLALVCLNTTAPFQNMRYATPTLTMLVVGAILGAGALARRGRAAQIAALALSATFLAQAPRAFPQQIDHYARASRNIVEQQVEVGHRLAALPDRPKRVFVGDAGAIPYVSGAGALDGLGLGGYHDLPFARASVHGVPAVLELIERMPPGERPDVLAIYDSWWPGLARFGKPMFDVEIEDNVICGDRKKSVYRADWSLLEDRAGPWLDRLDVADLVDERLHGYAMPSPHAGYVVSNVLDSAAGRATYDAGRIIPRGLAERFAVRGSFPRAPHAIVIRTDDEEGREVAVRIGDDGDHEVHLAPAHGTWSETRVPIESLAPGDAVVVTAVDGAFRSFAYTVE
jgi:hypothetical protein